MSDPKPARCPGPLESRRAFMRLGLGGMASLSLPGLLKLRAENAARPAAQRKSIIMVWLPGGLSHLDSYDPKPDSSSEYRGPFATIPTKVPGLHFTELMPRQAGLADKFTVLRSMHQTAGGHPAGSLQMLSGDPDTRDKPQPKYPDWMSVAHYLRAQQGGRQSPLPNYTSIHPINTSYCGPAYLGDAYGPFTVAEDPSRPQFQVPNIGLEDVAESRRLSDRLALRRSLDRMERAFDRRHELQALDEFEAQAASLLISPQARDAFDLEREDQRTRDRYGRHRWGQQLLLARRLVEAGVEIITSSLHGPQCGRTQVWDDHAVDHHIFEALRFRMGDYDQAVSALIEDLHERGLSRRVLVVVTGEFGRTPRITFDRSTGAGDASGPAGTLQPGRDHWPRAFSNVWAGGGIEGGGLIGATDKRGEDIIERPCSAHDFLATLYHHLGIDSSRVTLQDFNGRPVPIVQNGRPIAELMGSA